MEDETYFSKLIHRLYCYVEEIFRSAALEFRSDIQIRKNRVAQEYRRTSSNIEEPALLYREGVFFISKRQTKETLENIQ